MKIVERKYSPSTALAMFRTKAIPALLARVMSARGIKSIEEITGKLSELLPYSLLRGAVEAASLLADLIVEKKRLVIVADYDADGATACSVGIRGLRAFGADIRYLIPNRLEHGYGLTPDIVRIASEMEPRPEYIITVDNGIASIDGIAFANSIGIPVIVTDHHLQGDDQDAPAAKVIVNPNQKGCPFPSKALAGCGVMWYVLWALQDELNRRGVAYQNGFNVQSLLPIVAIGTVADVVQLDRNNRILVTEGLDRIHEPSTSFPGIESLAKVSKRDARRLTTSDIGFGLGPKINAAGRLESMDAGVETLCTDDPKRADQLAAILFDINERRREIESDTQREAVEQYAANVDPMAYTVTLHDDKWHKGVIGIVAGRIKERVYRPTFVLATGKNGDLTGSGRSIPGFHLRDALALLHVRHPDVMVKFGGHAMAAGVTIRAGTFDIFAEAFEAVAREMLSPALLNQVIEVDGSLDQSDMTLQTVAAIKAHVWGQGFPEPMFNDIFKVNRYNKMGENGDHLKMYVSKGGQSFEAVKFRYEGGEVPERVRLVYKMDANTFRDKTSLQLLVEYMEAA
jgi:single-stranded-DNA-specific exonuclease